MPLTNMPQNFMHILKNNFVPTHNVYVPMLQTMLSIVFFTTGDRQFLYLYVTEHHLCDDNFNFYHVHFCYCITRHMTVCLCHT